MEPEKFLPQRAPIEQFGKGGFRFAGMSHQGGLLVLPSGMRAWPVARLADLVAIHFAPLIAERAEIDFVIVGTGAGMARLPHEITALFQANNISLEVMATSAAVHIYNVVVEEGRRVAAAFLPVDRANV
jgi:uncharacterized protein